jgi:anti-sigma factor RsiW
MASEERVSSTPERRIQICFFFNAQRHQILHGIATAVELARDNAFEVYVVSPAKGHVDYARHVADRLGGAPITFVHTRSRLLAAGMNRTGSVIPPKLLSLTVLAKWLNGFDAIALPERTSMLLKRIGVRRPHYIHLDHGAGDRAVGFDRRIRHFDFVLMAGMKHRERLLSERLVAPAAHAVVGYPKFDAADAIRDRDWRPFDNDRPTIFYNPHFSDLGSWSMCGEQVLEAFAAQDRYNLIVAPHVRLLDSRAARERWEPILTRFDALPHILVDRGSDRAIDMTYTTLADLYLGDVSSQVYEFLCQPKPCLFLNPHGVTWQEDENYAHWHFGPVVADAHGLIKAVDRAFAEQPRRARLQAEAVGRTFLPGGGAKAAANAISSYLRSTPVNRTEPAVATTPPVRSQWLRAGRSVQRGLLLAPLILAGWMLHEILEPPSTQAAVNPFVERATASYRTTLRRLDMDSQLESRSYDRMELQLATGIVMPTIPDGWTISDTQLYPSTYGDIIQVSLATPAGEKVALVAMRIDTPADAKPLLETRASEHIAYWENGDDAFALVGRTTAPRLLQLASAIAG